ncbi:MAG: glycosyltransferase family 39 protein [Patescibacteria group bacterium]
MPKANPFTILAGVIIAGAVMLAVGSGWNEPLLVDEVPHIGAGYSYLTSRDMRFNPEHPPLVKDLAAFPLTFLNFDGKSSLESIFQRDDVTNSQWDFGRRLIYNSGVNPELATRLARVPMLLFFIASAVLLFLWARRLYGPAAAITGLILLAFSPTVLAHSKLITTDGPAMLGVLLAGYAFVNYLRQENKKTYWFTVGALGLALLLKFSTLLLLPAFLITGFIFGWFKDGLNAGVKSAGKITLLILSGLVLVVWPVYIIHTSGYPPERQRKDTEYLMQWLPQRNIANAIIWASDKPLIRAAGQYALGAVRVIQRSSGPTTIFYLGEISNEGRQSYFPLIYFLKEPLAWWLLALAALFAVFKLPWTKKNIKVFIKNHPDELFMLVWLGLYWTSSIQSNLNIGIRHLLPIYPFMIILVSGRIVWLLDHLQGASFKVWRGAGLILALVMGWYVFETIHAYPFFIPYFNQVAGGSAGGYRYVVDSNVDWGQDLKRLGQWMDTSRVGKIDLDYFGWADQPYYIRGQFTWVHSTTYKNREDFMKRNQSNGWIAVSVTFLQNSKQDADYWWLKQIEPTTTIGHSIFVWRIKD